MRNNDWFINPKELFVKVLRKPDIKCRADYLEYEMESKQKETRWVRCPFCSAKTRTKVAEDTVLVNFPLFCPKCKSEAYIDVVQFKMVLSD